MIGVENLQKSFAGQTLFEGLSFKINAKERIGLVARNGHGKTTLFRIIMGEESYDGGTLTIPKNYRIGMVRQKIAFSEDTVLKEGMQGLPDSKKEHHWEVEKVLAGLGFSVADMHRHPHEFSGGYQVRLNLAKVIVSEPDLLLLDEPTNYLDITSIRWIEDYLIKWPREVMLITHDRGFMDKVVTHILGIHRQKARKYTGNTEKYYSQIVQDEEIYEKTRINDERRRKEIEQFITRFRAKARLANLVQSRIKTLAKIKKSAKLEKIKTLGFSFNHQPFRGKHLLNARDVTFSYEPESPLIKGFNLSVNAGDRICVVGKNGKGKTTLLKLLTGGLKMDSGDITYNPRTEIGFFEQTNIQTLHDSRTVEEEILYSQTDMDRQKARDICGAMMFEGDAALKRIRMLSGGEKSRVLLGKIIAAPVNLLLLDEPTNHLDMDACDAMLVALDAFEGTILMVTHNEMFLHAIAERLIVFQGEGIRVFEGGYQYFLENEGWRDEQLAPQIVTKNGDTAANMEKMSKKEIRKKRSEIIIMRGRKLKPLDERIELAEADIEKHEQKIQELNLAMMTASQSQDGQSIAEISQNIHESQLIIDNRYTELEKLYQDKEKIERNYQQELEIVSRF